MDDLSMGVPGLDGIRPGTHVCALYSGPHERDRLLVPFMEEASRRGDRCVCLVDDGDETSSAEQLVAILAGVRAASADAELPLLRAAAEVSCGRPEPVEQLLVYESAVNELLCEQPALFLCMYDLQRFRVGTLVDVLRMHAKVLVDGTVLDNPRWVPPHRSSLSLPRRR